MVRARLGKDRFLLQQLRGGQTLSAFSSLDLPLNQRMHIQLVNLGNTPELRILPLTTETETVMPRALRELLPKQADIDDLIRFWELSSRTPSSRLPDSVRFAMEYLTAALPEKEQLFTADGLQKTLRDSGRFLEAKLAAQLTSDTLFLGIDLKARLLQLLAAIRASVPRTAEEISVSTFSDYTLAPDGVLSAQSPLQIENDGFLPEMVLLERLALKTEGALAKITVDQLASQPQDNGAVSLQLTIPFSAGNYQDNAKLFITSDHSETCNETLTSSWTATIELQPPGIGTFNARIVWNGSSIEATLWSDQEETGALMRSHCELLRARLEQAGLEARNVMVLDQPPLLTRKEADNLPLLDLHA